MSRITTIRIEVRFGDCDPARVVFFPRYHRWMDAASIHFFTSAGVPPWHQLERINGILGTPMLEHHTRYLMNSTYGETLEIRTDVEEWRRKTFVQRHTILRGDDLICESREIRVFCARDPNDRRRIFAVPIPEDILARCR